MFDVINTFEPTILMLKWFLSELGEKMDNIINILTKNNLKPIGKG